MLQNGIIHSINIKPKSKMTILLAEMLKLLKLIQTVNLGLIHR